MHVTANSWTGVMADMSRDFIGGQRLVLESLNSNLCNTEKSRLLSAVDVTIVS